MRIKVWIAVQALLALSLAAAAHAQVNATVSGTVSDATGAFIPGVEVVATNVNTGIATIQVSNESGSYNFASLQPGAYTLTAELPGFQTARYNNVQLSQGQQVRLNFTLEVSGVAQQVEVISDADTVLATTSSSVGDALPEVEVRSLPLATRNVLDLVATTAGAVGDNFGGARVSQLNTTRDGIPTTDGRFADWNGAYSATFTSPDLVEEVQVSVNSVDAAVGRGTGQVRMQTRSGGNEFHGALFYTNNNSAFNANGWFDNLVEAEKSYQNRNQFGGRLGGPIVRNKAFFFVLIDQQRYLEKENVLSTVLTEPARQGIFRFLTANSPNGVSRRNGNAFAATRSVDLNGNILTQDEQGRPLFVNQIDLFGDVNDPNRTAIDQVWVASQYLPRMPLPNDWTTGDGLNTAGFRWLRRHEGSDNATGTAPNTNRNHLSVRFDYQLNDANKISFSMTREKNWGVTGQTGLPSYPDGYFGEIHRLPDFYTASLTSTLSPTVLNEFRWGYKRDSWVGWTPPFLGFDFRKPLSEQQYDDIATEVRATFPELQEQLFYIQAGMGLGVYATANVAAPRDGLSPLTQFADTLSWTRGAHSFQGGFEATLTSSAQYSAGSAVAINPRSTLGIGSVPVPGINNQNFPGLNASDIGTAQNLLANLSGTVSGINHMYYVNHSQDTEWSYYADHLTRLSDWHQNDWAAFFKDTWQLTGNLTLNLGVRYDKYGVPWDSSGIAGRTVGGQAGLFGISGSGFDALWNPQASGGSPTEVQFIGKNSPNPDILLYPDDWNNVAPSIGFSYSLPGLGRSTVIRGGYGINYTGAPTLFQYTTQSSNVPGVALNVNANLPTYTNLAMVVNAPDNYLPIDVGGAQPLDPVPFDRNQGLQGSADDRVIPYVQNFNLSVQRELARNLTFEASYVGSKGTKLRGAIQLNEVNIFENGILEAFNVTRTGGDAPLFDQMLDGLTIGAVTVGTSGSGSEALRRFTTTAPWFANGDVAALAEWLDTANVGTGERGGLLRNPACAVCTENFIVANPQFNSVQLHGNYDNSIYHSLQTSLSKRMSQGFSGQVSYTWSKNLGNSLAGNANASDTTATVRDPRNRSLQRGLISFHRAHGVRGNATWDLPFGPNRALLSGAAPWVHRVVEGWQLSSIVSWNSGTLLEFTSPVETLGARSVNNTADLVGALPRDLGKVEVGDGIVQYFSSLSVQDAPAPNFGADPNNLAGRFTNQVVVDQAGNIVLQNPQPGSTGSTAYNLPGLPGPSSLGLDLAVSKRVQINETTTFTIRADAINALNTPQWGNPNTNINSSNFGRITSAGGARTFTLNARIDF